MSQAQFLSSGIAHGIVMNDVVHVLKGSRSSYRLFVRGKRWQYCCQDGCCDRGLCADVYQVVEQAKALGATKVILRMGQDRYRVAKIGDLPVEDVSDHVGPLAEGISVYSDGGCRNAGLVYGC